MISLEDRNELNNVFPVTRWKIKETQSTELPRYWGHPLLNMEKLLQYKMPPTYFTTLEMFRKKYTFKSLHLGKQDRVNLPI